MASYARLFEPGKIGTMTLRNRIVMGAMMTRFCDDDGFIGEQHIPYLAERAKGGAALITTDAAAVLIEGRMRARHMAIYGDSYIPPLRKVADAVHEHGAKMSVQLMHVGLRASESPLPTAWPIGPSARPYFLTGVAPKEATKEDIARLVDGYAAAAYRCQAAGCDAVEMHAAHGYLGSQFLSPFTNRREDEYGGSPEKRCRFLVEIVQRIKERCGADFPVLIKINGDDFFGGGVTVAETRQQARVLAAAGYDAIIVSAGLRESYDWQFQAYTKPIPAIAHLAAAAKEEVDIPVIAIGRIKTPAIAERLLEEGKADFVGLARPLIADPYWPAKAAAGRSNEIMICLGEHAGCLDRDMKTNPGLLCTINPAVDCAEQFRVRPAAQRKRVVVVGGGLGGMRAAATLAERGHQVTLLEESERLGGDWNCLADERSELRSIVSYLRQEMARQGVVVKLKAKAGAAEVRDEAPDAVVVALRARPVPFALPAEGSPVVEARAVLAGQVETGARVAVVGDDVTAVETALALAGKGKTVALISAGRTGAGIGSSLRLALLKELVRVGVQLFDGAEIIGAGSGHVDIARDKDVLMVPADTVVAATGFVHDDGPAREPAGTVPAVYTIKDAFDPKSALEAIRDGMRVGLEI